MNSDASFRSFKWKRFVMQKRLTAALALMVYIAILVTVVVFKCGVVLPHRSDAGPLGSPGLMRLGRPGPPLREAPTRLNRFAPAHANLVPFTTIVAQLQGKPRWSTAIINLVGNTVLFMPIGFLLPMVFRTMTWRRSLVLAVAVGLALEGMEGILQVGIVDIDDVILNACGVIVGFGFSRVRGQRGTDPRFVPSAP
ncbi:MAG: VanZ family protein [Verrucomicrobiota bacterium]